MKKSRLTFFLLVFAGFIISISAYFILPKRFFIDTYIYIYDKYNEIGFIRSYPITILFYKVTGLKYLHFSLIGAIQFSTLMLVLYKIGIPKRFHIVNIKNTISYLFILIIAIFLSMPTKEYLNFLYIAIIIFLFKNRKRSLQKTVLISLLLLGFFGVVFREYYILIILVTLGMYLISFINIKRKNFALIFNGLLIVIFLSLSHGLFKGTFISNQTRDEVNLRRLNKENVQGGNTIILPPIDTDSWYGESFGIVYGFFSVNLPINGLKHFLSPHIMLFIMLQFLLFTVMYIRFGKCIKEGRKNNYELWLFYFLFSYFIVQGVFEPDLGSSIRHKAGVFPLIYYLLYYEDFRKKLS